MQLGEVLHPGGVLRVAAGAQLGQITRPVQGRIEHLRRGGAAFGELAQPADQPGERLHVCHRPGGQAEHVLVVVHSGAEGDPLPFGVRGEHRLGPVPQPALGHVQDAPDAHRVVRVDDRAQVGDRVLDFPALVEPGAADHLVGQPDPDQHLLQRPGLGIGAVEDGHIARDDLPGVDQPVDLSCDVPGLLVLVVGHVADDLRTLAGVGPQVLHPPALVAGDHRVRRGQDRLRGPVVLLQQDGARLRVVGLELHDVADARAAEGVDGLVGITDHGQLSRRQGGRALLGRSGR